MFLEKENFCFETDSHRVQSSCDKGNLVPSSIFACSCHQLTIVMLWRIVDAVTDNVEDGEAGSLATASQQHFHNLAPDRRIVWSKLGATRFIVFCRNLGKSWAQELNSMALFASVNVFEKRNLGNVQNQQKSTAMSQRTK